MARGTPQYIEGSLPSSVSGDQVINLRAEIETVLQTYQSNATTAWETYDTIDASAGSLHRVYRSVGDRSLVSGAGDARLFIEIDQYATTGIQFSCFQDWSDLSSTGSNESGSTTARWTPLDQYSAIRYYAVVNEYEFVMLVIQNGEFHYVHFGSPIRSHVPPAFNGVAFTTAAATAGSSVTVNLDRDITANIQDSGSTVGAQTVWIYNSTPTSTALRAATIELAEVETIASGSITFSTLANSFDSGAIVGFDPSPMFVCFVDNTGLGGAVNPALYFTNAIDGTRSAPTTHIADYEVFATAFTAPAYNPTAAGFLQGSRAGISADQSTKGGYRGVSELVAFVNTGTLTFGDFWRPNGSVSNQYKVFSGITGPAITLSLALGPGAT